LQQHILDIWLVQNHTLAVNMEGDWVKVLTQEQAMEETVAQLLQAVGTLVLL
jgi:hypothetical protein